MKLGAVIAAAVVMLVASSVVRAHDEYRIIGTITAAQVKQIQVKDRQGKTLSMKVDEGTLVLRDSKKVDRAELKTGRFVVVDALGDWGHQWTFEQLREEDFDPAVLMWFLHRLVDVAALPERRVVVRFEFHEGRHRLWWLILHRPGVDLCLRDEGFEVDLHVPGSNVIVEVDGRGHRRTRTKEDDALKDQVLTALGYEVIRWPGFRPGGP